MSTTAWPPILKSANGKLVINFVTGAITFKA